MTKVNITHWAAYNSTESDEEVSFSALPSVLTIVIGVVIVAGNAITLLAIKSAVSFRTAPDFYLASLAVADGLVGITAISKIYTYFGPRDETSNFRVSQKYSCLAVLALASTSVMASTFSLALVALDRCLSVSYPFLYKRIASRKRTRQIILGAWFCSIVYGLLLVVFNKYSKHRKCLLVVQVDIWYFRYLTTSLSLIGMSVSIISYCKIGQILMRNQTKRVFSLFVNHFLCCLRSEELSSKSYQEKTSRRCMKIKNANPMLQDELFVRKELFTIDSVRKKGKKLVHLTSEGERVMKRENLRKIQMQTRSFITQENRVEAQKLLPSLTTEKHKVTHVLHHHDDIVYNDKPEKATSHVKKSYEERDAYPGEIDDAREDLMDKGDTGIYTSSMNNFFPDYFPADLIKSFVPVKKLEGKTFTDNCCRVAKSKSLPNLKYSTTNCPRVEFWTRGQCIQAPPMISNDWKKSFNKITTLNSSSTCLRSSLQRCQLQDLSHEPLAPTGQARDDDRVQTSQTPRPYAQLNFSVCPFENLDRHHLSQPRKKSDSELESTAKSKPSSCCAEDAFWEQNISGLSHRKSLSDQKLGRVFLAKDSARVIKVIFFTQMLFIVCLAPGFFLCLLYGLTNVPAWLINWAPFTAFLNSAMNIFVYASCKSRYRSAIWSILKCGHCRSV